MNDPSAWRWCPHCRRVTVNAPLPQLAEDGAHLSPLSAQDDVQAFHKKLYCTECRAIWPCIEMPAQTVAELLAAREALEDARRQIAMLRLLTAQQKQAQEQPRVPLRIAG
jgi:hypothetical protein